MFDNEFLKSVSHRRPASESHVGPHLMHQSIEQAWSLNRMITKRFADYADTNNAYACFETVYANNDGPQPMRRLEEHIFLFVLEGKIDFFAGGQSFVCEADTCIFVPRGELYWFNVLSQTARVLHMVNSADTFDARKTAELQQAKLLGSPARHLGLPSVAPPPDLQAFINAGAQNGVEYPGLAERGWTASRQFGLSHEERILKTRPESEADLESFVNARSTDSSVWYIGQLISFYIRGADTGGVACVFEGCPPRGFAPPPHIHLHEHETFFLRSGSIAATCAGTQVEAKAPALLFLPRGLVHTFMATSDDTKMLSWTNPTDSKRKLYTADVKIFEQLGAPAGALATPDTPTDLPDFETAIRIGLENGIVFPGLADPGEKIWDVGAGAEA